MNDAEFAEHTPTIDQLTPCRRSPTGLWWQALSLVALLIAAVPLYAGGTPDPGTSPLVADGGDADTLPDNENQLINQLGPDLAFGQGDYVSNASSGLQRAPGESDRDGSFRFGIEVPPGQSSLTVEIFDADIGAGAVSGTEPHDQNSADSWDTPVRYELLDPAGISVSSITLPPRDCDPITVGLQTGCDNAWSDLGVFSVRSPTPGHWSFRTTLVDSAGTRTTTIPTVCAPTTETRARPELNTTSTRRATSP